ncbi:MAG: Uncharacterised protein [Cryomorphaceae bacterium]|nr:MAG: Uncharacterised protein [Cryomorphaceae bacterium]
MKKTTTALLGFGYLALGLSMSGATGAWTAPTDTNEVRVEIDGIDPEAGLLEAITEIVKISTTEATKLSAQIAEIQALVEAGTLTEEEGEARTEALTEDFESRMENVGESMEEWGEEFGERMEAWGEEFGKKWESNDKAMDEAIGDAVERDLKMDLDFDAPEAPEAPAPTPAPKKSTKTSFDYFEFHFGANSLRDASGYETNTERLLSSWESLSTRFSFGTKRKIGGAASPFVFQSGLGLESTAFSFNNDHMIVKVAPASNGADATTEILPVTELTDVRRNRFDQLYLEIPMMLHIDFSKRGKVDESLTLGVGGYGGVRIVSEARLLGSDSEGERMQIRTNNNYNTHLFRYGLQAQVGYKAWKVTGRLDARTLFQQDAFNEEVYIGSVTLGIAL